MTTPSVATTVLRVGIVGAGPIGRNLARALVRRGDNVIVLSPRPVDVPALWAKADAVTGRGLRAPLGDCDVVVYAAGTQKKGTADEVYRLGARHAAQCATERFILVGPTGASARSESESLRAHHHAVALCRASNPAIRVVRLPLLFGRDDHLLGDHLDRIHQGRSITPRWLDQQIRPLAAGDAVKLLLRAVDGEQAQEVVEATGPETLTGEDVLRILERHMGAQRALISLRGRLKGEDAPRLKAQLAVPDSWPLEDERVRLEAWVRALQSRTSVST